MVRVVGRERKVEGLGGCMSGTRNLDGWDVYESKSSVAGADVSEMMYQRLVRHPQRLGKLMLASTMKKQIWTRFAEQQSLLLDNGKHHQGLNALNGLKGQDSGSRPSCQTHVSGL